MTHVTSARDKTNGDGLPRVPSIPLTDDRAFDPSRQSIGDLVRDATTHMSTLLRAEIELAKAELAKEMKKVLVGSIFFIIALAVFVYSTFFLFFMEVDVLDIWLDRWVASIIVWVEMLAVAALMAFLGVRKMKKLKAPERTISTLRETADTLAHFAEDDKETGTAVSPVDPARNQPRPR
ncbi:MAG TPA: phage holin family protein [Actinophytocola sp.]|uniref:phage holin family protein n=1 Tax=Actinophytocola sp. TaxID=1872138 RepID=UPI002DB6BF45|nr:phage holin family protein [Actinophytocola sp.]HEU5471922.1 phage holin family protein [Actinophytocola sp.]